MGRSYGFAKNGYLYQLPIGYYASRRVWDMAPGYENDRVPDFSRPITAECLFCHASGVRIDSHTVNRVSDVTVLDGISCDRCHGDPSDHLAHPQKANIVNPKTLPPTERDSICEQCHLAGEARFQQPGRDLYDFRPGQNLSMYLAVFVRPARPSEIRVNGHAEALASSRCRQLSGQRLWCGSCHTPHGRQVDYREVCLGCHSSSSCPKLESDVARSIGDCMACHMPKRRAFDGGHTVFTDHSISRRPANPGAAKVAPASLESYYPVQPNSIASDRNLGIAWAQVAEEYRDARLFEKAWPFLRRAASAGFRRDPALYAKVGEALESASNTEEAKKAYQLSLDQDPDQVGTLLQLAALLDRTGERSKATVLRKRAAALLPRQ
jgi:hypothetical protein